MSTATKNLLILLTLILIGMSTRFIFIQNGESILPNFTALGAVALFGIVYLKGVKKWIVPFVALWLSDMVLNNLYYAEYFDGYQLYGSLWVYAAFIVMIFAGKAMMKNPSWTRLAFSSIGIAIIFFLITNFGSWLSSPLYTKDLNGLMSSYANGIPFFRNTVVSNLFFSFLLFGVYEFGIARLPQFSQFRLLAK